jgi:hypothetical protein
MRSLTAALTILAILSCALLLVANAVPRVMASLGHVPLSAAPLILIGTGYMALQCVLRPAFKELLQRLLLGLAFVLWGVDQLLPANTLAAVLGDVVIILFVADLGVITFAHLRIDDKDTP